MKKLILAIALVITLSITFMLFQKDTKETEVAKPNMESEQVIQEVGFTFSVLSDVHTETEKLEQVIADLNSIDKSMETIVFNGDNVEEGLPEQYNAVSEILKKNSNLLPPQIIHSIGNHEFFHYQKGVNKPEEVETFIKRYLDFSGEKSVYHDHWIKGYHFIVLGSEIGNTEELGSNAAFISEMQQQWLKEKLVEKHEKGKPIFVFVHQPLTSTSKTWTGVKQGEEISRILSQYPEAILFTSHTHASLVDSNVRLDQPFTTVNTGAVQTTFKTNADGKRERVKESQGLYVKVLGNKVTIMGRDFERRDWIFTREIKSNNLDTE